MKQFNQYESTHPLEFAFAFKKGGSKPTEAQKKAEIAQEKELADLQAKEDSRTAAVGRKRRGRASLISGTEEGLKKTLG